jgi:hypothetical protein
MRHKHADVITAWANGKSVSFFDPLTNKWLKYLGGQPFFNVDLEWRIDPEEPKWWENIPEHGVLCWYGGKYHNLPTESRCIDIIVAYRPEEDLPPFISTAGTRYAKCLPLTNEEIERFKR